MKLTSSNYISWRAQFHSFLFGYDLLGYINETSPSLEPFIIENNTSIQNPSYTLWKIQDQLILHAILASLSEAIISFVSSATTTRGAWDCLVRRFANRSRSRIMYLKGRFTSITQGIKPVSEYLYTFKGICDELALIGVP